MKAPISVLLIEDHSGTREALAAALRLDGLVIAGALGSAEAALEALPSLHADVALVDLGLPRLPGVELIRRLRKLAPGLAVLVLTVFEQEELIIEAIEAGAQGYLLKDASPGEVRVAIEQVMQGLAPLSPAVARHVLARLRTEPPARPFGLSDRELEVLGLLARGYTYASAAQALGIGVGTVQTHVKAIYRKLEVSSKTEAAAVARRNKLFPPG